VTRLGVLAALGLALAISPAAAAPVDRVPWGQLEHRNKDTLARWLAEHGASYETWADRHPAAASWLEGRTFTFGFQGPDTAATTPAAEPTSAAGYGWVVALLASVGLALLVMAWALSLPLCRARLGGRLIRGQGALALAGAGLLVSVAVGYGLTFLSS
jgi:hypothetical protein